MMGSARFHFRSASGILLNLSSGGMVARQAEDCVVRMPRSLSRGSSVRAWPACCRCRHEQSPLNVLGPIVGESVDSNSVRAA